MKISKITVFKEKGAAGTDIREGQLVRGKGISGDAGGAKGGPRQISFIDESIVEDMRLHPESYGICAGRYKANITTQGCDFSQIHEGDLLKLGRAQVEITVGSKKCWPQDCDIAARGSECPLKRGVAMGSVKTPGTIKAGDTVTLVRRGKDNEDA